jgi:hypothetical protein
VVAWFTLAAERFDVAVAATEPSASRPASAASTAVGLAATPAEAARFETSTDQPCDAVPPSDGPTISGRCIDTRGKPLAGVAISWCAAMSPANGTTTDAARSDTEGAWQVQPDRRQSAWILQFSHLDHVPLERRVEASVQRRTVELGDVVLTEGVRVTCRILTQAGQPLAHDRQVWLEESHRGEFPCQPARIVGTTGGDGACTLGPLLPGRYSATVAGEVLLAPRAVVVAAAGKEQEVVLTVADAAAVRRITGTVLDADGRPATNARIVASTDRRLIASTAGNDRGEFALAVPAATATAPVRLAIHAPGHDVLDDGSTVDWGTTGLVRSLRRGVQLTLRVVDAANAPCTDYRLELQRVDGPASFATREVREPPHADGVAMLDGLPRGAYAAHFARDRDGRSFAVEMAFDVREDAQEFPVLLPELSSRVVRIVDQNDRPWAGSTVELLDANGSPVTADTMIVPAMQAARTRSGDCCRRIDSGCCDAAGMTTLTGIAARRYWVRVVTTGPTLHELEWHDTPLTITVLGPQRRTSVRLDPATTARAMAAAWPDCTLTLVPASAVGRAAALVRAAGRPVREPFHFEVCNEAETLVPWFTTPSGTVAMAPLPTGGEITVDVRTLHPARLRGVVQSAGQPAAYLTIRIDRVDTQKEPGRMICPPRTLRLDGHGAYACTLLPGDYRVHLLDGTTETGTATEPPLVRLAPGDDRAELHTVKFGRLRLRLVDPAGHPVAAATTMQLLRSGDRSFVCTLPPTDSEGRSLLDRCAPGAFVVRILPRRLGSAEQRRAHCERLGNPAALTTEYLDIAQVLTAADVDTDVIATLPAEWSR